MKKNRKLCEKQTYCNPLSIPECPRGVDGTWDDTMLYSGEPKTDYRSISDPSVLYYDNKWYIYPSYGMAFVSEDFVTWKHHRLTPYNLKYSPSVIPHRGKFLLTGHSNGLYIGDSPLGPFEFLGDFYKYDGTIYTTNNGFPIQPIDSALFADDDGKIYLYFFDMRDDEKNNVQVCQTYGVELDGDNPNHFACEPKLINEFNGENYWERDGAWNQDTKFGWVEGQWMFKHNGRYYMIYASPSTSCKSYCMAAYYSDEGPLTGFVQQKNNPITEHRQGLVSGAGHGSITHGPNGSIWAFYTITRGATHPFERCIGMDPIGIDENGELYCPSVSDIPQLGVLDEDYSLENHSAEVLPLTFSHRHHIKSTSHAPGRGTLYAFDESMITWWQPLDDDKEPALYVDLESDYVCEASRIIWRDNNLDYDKGIIPGPYQYIIEGRMKVGEGDWTVLIDKRNNQDDFNIDYRTFEPIVARELRLRIIAWPKGITPGVVSFCVFGTRA